MMLVIHTGVIIPDVGQVIASAVVSLADYRRIGGQVVGQNERCAELTGGGVVCEIHVTVVTVVFLMRCP